jgi:carbon storage regulator
MFLGGPVRGRDEDRASGREVPTMLVLTRKSNQSIMIGDDIEVSVLSIMGEKVRIGIQAPRDVPVFRARCTSRSSRSAGASPRARSAPTAPTVESALHKLGEQ